jgi:hypothetical protein
MLRYGLPLPWGDFYGGIYVDDYASGWIADDKLIRCLSSGPDVNAAAALTEAYNGYGVSEKESKTVNASLAILAWGKELDGDVGLGSSPPAKILVTQVLTLQMLMIPRVSRKVLEMVTGAWGPLLLDARAAYAVLDDVFRYTASLKYDRWYVLPSAVRDELLSVVILGPMLAFNMRCTVNPEVLVMDASLHHAGCCGGRLPQQIVDRFGALPMLRAMLPGSLDRRCKCLEVALGVLQPWTCKSNDW